MNRLFNEGTIGPSWKDQARDVGASRACSSGNPFLCQVQKNKGRKQCHQSLGRAELGEGTIQGELELWKEATSVKTTLPQEVGNGGTKYPDIYLLPTTLATPNQKPVYKGAWMTQSLEVASRTKAKKGRRMDHGWSNGEQLQVRKKSFLRQ